jgi:hypothetical protein
MSDDPANYAYHAPVETEFGTSMRKKIPTQRQTRPPGVGPISGEEARGMMTGDLRRGVGDAASVGRYRARQSRGEVD